MLADLCNALNPEAIVVGGELSRAGEPLLGGIREAVDRYALPGAAQVVQVVHCELAERAEVLGALALVIGNTEGLGSAGLARSVVVVATSDEPALMRRQAGYLTLAVAEYFRDLGKDVLVLMDSVTRFAVAQREIGLSAGEPPTAKGFTPTVFTELPRLLERAGPGTGQGTITGLFTVLVEGDDHNEPVADAVRSILDGHIVMERQIAERGRYPAINILRSVSRTMPKAADQAFVPVLSRARQVMATYADMEELIRLGAYRPGSSPEVDEAIRLHQPLEEFLGQAKEESTSLAQGYQRLAQILRPSETEK